MNTKLNIILLTLIISSLFSSCDCTSSYVNSISEYELEHPEGFTVCLYDMSSPQYGIAVAYELPPKSSKKLRKIIKHSIAHDGYIGLWLDPSDSILYYDSIRLFPEDSLDFALKFGEENNQKAIYMISKDSLIWVNHFE